MTPIFHILADRQDITAKLADRLLSLAVTDETEHGFAPVVGEGLAAIAIPHLDQSEESDINLLQRLAGENGAVAKPAHGKLLFAPRSQAKTASGKSLPNIALGPGDVDSWRVTLAERAKYRSVVAKWQDRENADLAPEQAGEGDPVYSIRHTYRDADQARRAAAAKLDAFERGSATLNLALPGRPEAGAECPLLLTGFRPGVDGRWIVTRAGRRIEDGGYTCSLSAEAPKEGFNP